MKRWMLGWIGLGWLASLTAGGAGIGVQFHTAWGDVQVELYDQDKPVTVRNFLQYIRSGRYQNTFIHRCVPGFVAQGGGFLTVNRADTNLAGLFYYVPSLGSIANEFNSGRRFSNTRGTLAMAKLGGDPNSATCQWFFNLADNSANLDAQNGGFTVFGRVVAGLEVLDRFNGLSYGAGLVDMTAFYGSSLEVLNALPVLYSGLTPPHYTELVYVDLTVLEVRIRRLADASREISWNSVSNRINVVEYAAQIPPVWQVLTQTTGNGQTQAVTDADLTAPRRFYRVRVVY